MTTCSKNFDRLLQAACLGLVGMLAVAGCGGSSSNPSVDAKAPSETGGTIPGPDGPPPAGTLSIDKVTVPFGSVDVGATSTTQVVTVTNSGSQPVAIVPSINGSNEFTITDTCAQVPATGSCSISVVFQPTAVGQVSGVLSISSTLTVSLGGKGVPQGSFSVAGVNLGDKVPTNSSITGAVTVTATVSVTDLSCNVSGADLTADPAKVCPAALAAGISCTVGFTFKATSPGSKADSVTCIAAGVPKTAIVTATVLDTAKLAITPPSASFQSQSGTQSAAVTFGVANSGGLSTGQISATITGANADQFAITVPGCLAPLAGAAGCSLQVVCNPTSVGTKSATLSVADTSGAATTVTAPLTCVSVGPTTLTVTGTANLGSVVIGSTGTPQNFTVKNTGTAASGALTVTLSDPQFVKGSDTCTGISLDANATCSVVVSLHPTSAGSLNAILNVTAATGNPGSIQLSGVGLTAGVLTVSPASYDFLSIPNNQVSADASFTVTNGGGAATGALTVSSPGNGFVVAGNGCSAALAPGKTCVFAVHFAPTVAGNATGTVTVTDGTVSGSTLVHGTGVAPSILSVTPNKLDFGNVVVGYAETTVTLTSSSFQILDVSVESTATNESGTITEVLSGANAADFAVSAKATTCSASLQPGQSCFVSVTFTPSGAGLRQAVLTVNGSKGATYQVQLQGVGLALVQLIPMAADSTATTPVTGLDFAMQPNGTKGTKLRYRAVVRGDVNPAATSTVATIGLAAGSPPDFTYVDGTGAVTTTNPCNTGATLALPPTGTVGVWNTTVLTATNPGLTGATGDGQVTGGYWTCDFYVVFYPQSGKSTTPKTATLSASTAGGAQAASLTLSGISSGPLTISPLAPTFATVPVETNISLTLNGDGGANEIKTFTVANMGVGAVDQGPLTVALTPNSGDFAVIDDTCTTVTLHPAPAAGNTCTITVGFAPTSAGNKTATLTVTATGSGETVSTTMSGTASQPGAFTVTPTAVAPASIDFGSVAQANVSAWKTFTISNPATGSLTGKLSYSVSTTVALGTTDFQVFDLSNSGATSYPAGSCGDRNTKQLDSGESCTIQVRFAPTNAASPSSIARPATLTVTDNFGTSVSIPIQGTATAQLTLSGSAISVVSTVQTLAFGNVATGAQMPETFTITNNGAADLALTAAAIPAGFTVTSDACKLTTVLHGGGSCDMTLVFVGAATPGPLDPNTQIAFTGATGISVPLALTATTVRPAVLALYGFGEPNDPFNPTKTGEVIDLGSVPTGASSGVLTLWFTNTGGVAANSLQTQWILGGGQFSLAEAPGTCSTVGSLAPNATCSVNVQFTPTATGAPQSAQLSLFGAAITPVNVNLRGTGIATSNSVYAKPINGTNTFYTFGTTVGGATTGGPTAYFVLYNNTPTVTLNLGSSTALGGDIVFDSLIGTAAVPEVDFTLTKATTTGAGVACGLTLAPAAFCTFAVTFQPTAWVDTGRLFRWASVKVSHAAGTDTPATDPAYSGNILGVLGQVQKPAKLQLSATATSPVTITGTTSPFLVEFGQILQGQTPSQTFTITNIGQATTAGAPSLNLSAAATTYATIGTSTCTAALIPGATCTVVVNSQLTSTLGGQSGIAVTAVDTAGSGENSAETYNLRAEVVNPVSLIVTAPSSTAFADTRAGVQATVAKTIVVTNGSNTDTLDYRQATSALQVTLSDTTNFAVDPTSSCLSSTSSTGYKALPTSTSSSCNLVIDFLPLAAGALTTTVSVTGASPSSVTLTGTGQSDLTTTLATPAFTGTPLLTDTITVHNNGGHPTKLLREKLTGTNASAFVIVDDNCYGNSLVATSGTCTVTVAFIGTVSATTAQTASLNVTDGTANNTVDAALSVGGP